MSIYALDGQEPQIHETAYVHPDATVIGSVLLGANVNVWPGAVLRADYGRIEVGDGTSIQDGAVVHTTEEWPTLIGAGCVVGHNVHLEGCVVNDGCLIGSNSTVLNRANVAAGCVVAAAALVPEGFVVPAGQMAIGVPAKLRASSYAAEFVPPAVALYSANAQRYRTELRRLD